MPRRFANPAGEVQCFGHDGGHDDPPQGARQTPDMWMLHEIQPKLLYNQPTMTARQSKHGVARAFRQSLHSARQDKTKVLKRDVLLIALK